MYASDASNYRMVPLGVVLPKDSDDVVAAVGGCRRFGAPIFARGGGTSIPGQTVNNGVVFDFSKYMNRIIELNPDQQTARVQPGMVLDTLRNASNKFGLTFGPDPATHSRCTLGGMIANNSCGIHSVTAGETSDNIEELEILTYDGTRMRVGPTNEHDLAQITRAQQQHPAIDGRRRAPRPAPPLRRGPAGRLRRSQLRSLHHGRRRRRGRRSTDRTRRRRTARTPPPRG